jgi:hypothetical protein
MTVPPIQIPRPRFDDNLLASIAAGDCQRVRTLFDEAFWDGYKIFLTWKHLQTALRRENKTMLRLLISRGAEVSAEELVQFRPVAKNKYPHYIHLLRQGGLKLPAGALAEIPCAEPEVAALNVEKIPGEWRLVLQAAQDKGASEAVIAGGALRDLFNERAVKDVDIFLKTRGSERKNKAFLKEVFNATGLAIESQSDYSTTYHGTYENFPSPKGKKLILTCSDVYATIFKEGHAESWTVIAGPQKTEYNIVFLDNVVFKDLPTLSGTKIHSRSFDEDYFKWSLIQGFDFGLCQIACDGREVVTTPFYKDDVKNNQISLRNPNKGSKEHLERLVRKYPDWELCPKSKALLEPQPRFGHF